MTLYTVPAAVAWLNEHTTGKSWSKTRVYALVASGQLPSTRIGGRRYVTNLETFLASPEPQPSQPTAHATLQVRRFGHPTRRSA